MATLLCQVVALFCNRPTSSGQLDPTPHLLPPERCAPITDRRLFQSTDGLGMQGGWCFVRDEK